MKLTFFYEVKDGVEKNLKKEVENIRKYQQKMKTTLENVMMTLEEHREANESLNKDLNNKEQAYVIDRCLGTLAYIFK